MKSDLDADLYVDRLAILQCGLKTPLLDCLNRFCVESISETANHTDVARLSLFVDDQPQNAGTLSLRYTRFLGIFRVRSGHRLRRRNPAANLENASADSGRTVQ